MDSAQSGKHVVERASMYMKSQADQVGHWLVHYCREQRTPMMAPKTGDARPAEPPLNLVSNFESLLFELHNLLIWDNKFNSAVALTAFTTLYWTAVLLSPRLFSIIAVVFFCYHFYEMWTRYLWPEIRVPPTEVKENWTSVNLNVLSAPEIQNYLARFKKLLVVFVCEIADLRSRSHGTFCFLSIFFLGLIYILGRVIPGAILVYGFALIFFLTPGFLLHVLPHHSLESLLEWCNDMLSQKNRQPSECTHTDLHLTSETTTVDTVWDEAGRSSTPSPFKSQSYEHFFPKESASQSATTASTSDISDADFEIISEVDLGEMEMK